MIAAAQSVATGSGSEQAYFETSPDLLSAIAEALDIASVLPRVSKIANALVSHDALVLAFVDASGELLVHSTAADFAGTSSRPRRARRSPRRSSSGTFAPKRRRPRASIRDGACWRPGIARSCRSRQARASSSCPSSSGRSGLYAFGRDGVPMAHRVAEHLAVAVAHEALARARATVADAPSLERTGGAAAHRAPARPVDIATSGDTRVVGESAPWRNALRMATQVAATEATVLVTGESGTGKEVLARYIHRTSSRHRGPFVALNCAALPEHLLESELFGYERGAFTGAQQPKPGMIEMAAGGVLFLDEVTEMSLSAQAKFLRVLQEREFQRLGGTRPLKANIRVIAASNRDLRQAVERGDFREDLYYRLQVFPIVIPPLRDRRDDILPLSEALLHDIGSDLRHPPAGLTREARQALIEHEWPGNVRELRNALERAAILSEGDLIGQEHLALDAVRSSKGAVASDLGTVECTTISRVMSECRGNKSRAARRLGLSRTQLYFRLRRYGIEEQVPA